MKPRIILSMVLCTIVVNAFMAQVQKDIVQRKMFKQKPKLEYPQLREADIFWEKHVWQVIDCKQKMNMTLRYPKAPLFNILKEAVEEKTLSIFSDESFENQISDPERIFSSIDTIIIFDPIIFKEEIRIIHNDLNYEDIQKYRLKEIWFFDENTSSMNVRIIGIAPIIEVKDDDGNFRFEKPLFWFNYPQARAFLSQAQAFNPFNDTMTMSWDDIFQMRYFDSTISKVSNILDARLEDLYSGEELLLEARKAEQEIFNMEQDFWTH